MALADEFDGLLIDLDGVVWVGREPVPGAAEALAALLDAGKEIVFVTNNPGATGRPPTPSGCATPGVDVGEDGSSPPAWSTARLAAEAVGAGGSAFVIGAPALQGDGRRKRGWTLLDGEAGREADAVVVSGHREFDYEELLTATLALQRGAALFATSRDPTLPMPGGAWPGTGAMLAAVETASGRRAEIGGKPERHLFELACDADRRRRRGWRWSATGSPPTSRAGRRAGLETILVLSGATSREEAEGPTRRPTTSSTTSPACCDERRRERRRAGTIARPGVAFAGIFTVTFCGLLAVGAVLPVLPRYVHGPLDAGNVAVGVVIGSYAITGLLLRPFAGRFADRRGRKPPCWLGSLLVAVAGFLYLLPFGVAGLIAARLVLGAGEGTVFTAGSAWIVDIAPARAARPGDRPLRPRRLGRASASGRWSASCSCTPPATRAVWIFAGAMPLLGALVASRLPDPFRPLEHEPSTTR